MVGRSVNTEFEIKWKGTAGNVQGLKKPRKMYLDKRYPGQGFNPASPDFETGVVPVRLVQRAFMNMAMNDLNFSQRGV
jgi:hypothetical protein